ncbi:large proline-rich protein BAG6 isoform X2 [Dendrobium catenatum]|uniref:large proline-rich protein BAG6 isoform X2 n=1 Tax=Dendrobium catenatum TaxID=906689 RepID=UPI0009F5B406|nr:large proline-rich protein BAG6 isoform X2 [Dendrobium catenatum]
MTSESSLEGSSSIQVNLDSSESTIGINIKTLDSRTFSLRVNKNIPVPDLKEMIVTTIGVPPEQQRLIYRGKVLKDEQLLSELHMEDGDTLHLVLRQPTLSQPTSSTVAAEASRASSSQANDSGSGVQRNRVGQVAHGVLVGTINVADRNGEAMLTDISRNIESFLGSLGLVTVDPTGATTNAPTVTVASSGGLGISQNTSRTEPINSAHEGFVPSNNSPQQASIQFSQLPLIRTLNQPVVISNAVTTLSEFIDRMELVLQSHNGSPNSAQHQPRSEASSVDARGLPTLDFLCSIMERAQQLLRDSAASALAHVSTRLQREGSSSDPVLRGQIQNEAMQLGVAMQHLGALLLELGRTIMTLRMGQSPAEFSVNSGPAVYISPIGPNPIMVQPSSLFGAPPLPLVSGLSVGASPGNPLSNINIHLHAGNSTAPGVSSTVGMTSPAETIHGDRPSTEQTSLGINGSSDSSTSTRGLPLRAVVSATPARTVPEASGHVFSVTYPVHIRAQHSIPIQFASPQGAGSALSGAVPPPSVSVPAIVAQVTARIASALTGNAQAQSSSTSTQPIATQGAHSVVSSGTLSDLSTSALQAPQMNISILHTTPQSNMPSSSLRSDSQDQNPSSLSETSQESSSGEENVLACQEDLYSGNDDARRNSVNTGFPEHGKGTGSGENCTSDLIGSGKEGQHLEGNQINNLGSGISVEESSTPSSSKVLADCQSSSSDIRSFNREPKPVEFQKPPSSSSQIESNTRTPLGLGFGGLRAKKRSKPVKPKGKDDGQAEASSSDQSQHSIGRVHEAVLSVPSQISNVDGGNNNGSSSQLPSLISQFMNSMPSVGQDGSGQTDFGGMIANAMQSSAFNNLLTGVASQSRVASGDLRSMLLQCVQSPAVQNTVNQLVEEVGQSQNNGNIQSTGQNRLDFTGMIQQMLPVVSQALGRSSTLAAPVQDMQSERQPKSIDVNNQVDLSQALEKIEQDDDPRSIFRTLLEITGGHLYGEENTYQDIVELANDEELAREFMEVLKRDIKRRLEGESTSEDKS